MKMPLVCISGIALITGFDASTTGTKATASRRLAVAPLPAEGLDTAAGEGVGAAGVGTDRLPAGGSLRSERPDELPGRGEEETRGVPDVPGTDEGLVTGRDGATAGCDGREGFTAGWDDDDAGREGFTAGGFGAGAAGLGAVGFCTAGAGLGAGFGEGDFWAETMFTAKTAARRTTARVRKVEAIGLGVWGFALKATKTTPQPYFRPRFT